jgi:hypothetical protein
MVSQVISVLDQEPVTLLSLPSLPLCGICEIGRVRQNERSFEDIDMVCPRNTV